MGVTHVRVALYSSKEMDHRQMQSNEELLFHTPIDKLLVLGCGSFGKVWKAKCDDLLCAAKVLHETLFDPTAEQHLVESQSEHEHRLPNRRFKQECQFLSTMRHPNIVQYLGTGIDPDTGLPALLMELMDDSLTHFVESYTQPIPYHIAVNICHDIALALSYLHSKNIIHRDLSSNNVLLIGNVRAKVTDFGMVRLGDQNPQATHLTFTMCPGTDVFMPPEAVRDRPVYTEKIDCFSFGVITLQILTRKFPKPGDRRKSIEISHPDLPGGIAEVPVSEIERRQNHISEVDPDHPLLQVTLDCLKDRDVERPSAQQLCERVAALKECQDYEESKRDIDETKMKLKWRAAEKAPREVASSSLLGASVDSCALYVRTDKREVYAYSISNSSWSRLPKSPSTYCPSVVINNLLTLVGGATGDNNIITNQLFTLSRNSESRQWSEEFPRMLTKRQSAAALCNGAFLIVAGGKIKEKSKFRDLDNVEVMNVQTKQWFLATALFHPMSNAPAVLCGKLLYIMGVSKIYVCSIDDLIRSCKRRNAKLWSIVDCPPVVDPAFVSINGQLLAIGGRDSKGKPSAAVYLHHPISATEKWEVISHMEKARYKCVAAVLPSNEIMVVGGGMYMYERPVDLTEIASIN